MIFFFFEQCLKSKEYELLAYDLIGMQFYYLEDLERSHFFHEKMMRGNYEEDSSPLKLLGIAKVMNKRVFKSEMERTDFTESYNMLFNYNILNL